MILDFIKHLPARLRVRYRPIIELLLAIHYASTPVAPPPETHTVYLPMIETPSDFR